jgi:hypothetical protein
MQHARTRILALVGALTLLALSVAAVSQWAPYAAYGRLNDLEWSTTASPQALRENAHRALAFWFGDPHDAFLILGQYGDASSIPYLKAALARQPKGESGMECTWAHGRDALERLARAPARVR